MKSPQKPAAKPVQKSPKASFGVRPATLEDLDHITHIYNDAVLNTTATFDIIPRTKSEQLAWFDKHGERHPVLVIHTLGLNGEAQEVVGWGSLGPWSDRSAYDDSGEVSIYIAKSVRGLGLGMMVLENLIAAARTRQFHTLLARISDANEPSLKLHKRFGFEQVGLLKEVGFKFNRWIDVHFYQLIL